MELFDRCEMCGKGGTSIKKVVGTFIHLKQSCKNCNHMREWDSQPFIKNIPAGNILLSASILFGGGLPSQVMTNTHTTHASMHTYTHSHTHTPPHYAYMHSQVLRILDYFGCASTVTA